MGRLLYWGYGLHEESDLRFGGLLVWLDLRSMRWADGQCQPR